ncbi:MAG: hypothetical protein AAF596_07675 [Planctomycetota bacterium]
MKIDPNPLSTEVGERRTWAVLAALTASAACCYFALLRLGPGYELSVPTAERPILLVIAIYAAAFVPCWIATRLAARLPSTRRLVGWVIGSSVLFRLLVLPTPPFQEIDIYRYLWDGAVVGRGESPYAYPPAAVEGAIAKLRSGEAVADGRLAKLARAGLSEPALGEIVERIHYAELPSPYPPVSQAFFAAPALVTPSGWTAVARLNLLKGVLTAFDVATLITVLLMLRRTGRPLGLAVAYGWCPLVIKEVAGSGHLDAIAIFFSTAAVAVGLRSAFTPRSVGPEESTLPAMGSAVLLALGVGAKLYPVVLSPLFLFAIWRRQGWRRALAWGGVFTLASALLLAPMFFPSTAPVASSSPSPPPPLSAPPSLSPAPPAAEIAPGDGELPPAPNEPTVDDPEEPSATTPTAGLTAFLSRWEMNDLLFMIVVENLREQDGVEPDRRPWFAVVPDSVSRAVTQAWQRVIDPARQLDAKQASFLLARAITAIVFTVIALPLAWRAASLAAAHGGDPTAFVRAAFLTLAWFWLLAPTQNPWYWCWAVPLLPFMRLASWHLLAACCLLYYTRFWLAEHRPDAGVLGTPYDGVFFFYFVVAWVEFLPWMLVLAMEAWLRRTGR